METSANIHLVVRFIRTVCLANGSEILSRFLPQGCRRYMGLNLLKWVSFSCALEILAQVVGIFNGSVKLITQVLLHFDYYELVCTLCDGSLLRSGAS